MPEPYDPQDSRHSDIRMLLRIVGPAIGIVGLMFTIVGMVSFFSAFGGFERPRQFWCAFVGLPLMVFGGAISQFAYAGAVARYMADEIAPVGKDVVNYMAGGVKQSVRDVAAAVGEGLQSGMTEAASRTTKCAYCNTENPIAAHRCSACGTALTPEKKCAGCGKVNSPDARFCNNCGTAIA
jgi:Double zinc ribbon